MDVEDLQLSREALAVLVGSQDGTAPAHVDIHIDMSPAVDAAALLGVPDLELEKITYNCVNCHARLRNTFVCTGDVRLAQLEAPWVCCNACFPQMRPTLPADATFVHLTGVVPQRYAYHSFALRMRNRFLCYAPAQCIGEVVSNADNGVQQQAATASLRTPVVHYVTYAEVYQHARRLATTLQLTVGAGGVVALRSENRGWWIAGDAAIAFGNYVCAPVATSVAPAAMRRMLQMTDTKALLVSGAQFDAMVKCVTAADPEPLDALKLVIVLGEFAGRPTGWPNKVWLMGYREALAMGADVAPINFSADPPRDMRTLIFTSGSTGAPKAVMLSDAQMSSELDTVEQRRPSCSFCFEPLALAASRINTWRSLMNGGRVDMFSGNFGQFWSEVRGCSPHWFSATPRIWNWAYSNYKARFDALLHEGKTPGQRALFLIDLFRVLTCENSTDLSMSHSARVLSCLQDEAESTARDECKAMFGSRCRSVQTGSALTSPEVFKWMTRTFAPDMSVFDGYGSTEAGAIASNFKQDDDCVVYLEDMPEMGYLTSDKPVSRGLLWVHTPTIAMGYYNSAAQTSESFRDVHGDGRIFFNTGDIVTYDAATRELRVIDRAKNMFKLAQGAFISPEALEGIFVASPFVEQAFVYAEPDKEFVLAVVVVAESVLRNALEAEPGTKAMPFAELCALPAAEAAVLQSLQRVGTDRGVSAYEIPRAVLLESVRWSPDAGTMTPSFKTNRIGLRAKYGPRLTRRYAKLLGGGGGDGLATSQTAIDLTASQLLDVVSAGGPPPAPPAFRAVLRTLTGRDCRTVADAKLVTLGLDSVGMVQLAGELERQLGVVVPYTLLYSSTVGALEEHCDRAQQRRLRVDDAAEPAVDYEAECTLPPAVAAGLHLPDKHAEQHRHAVRYQHFLLTGATGFLGVYVLRAVLAAQPHARVHVLVRGAADDAAAMQRVRETATRFGVDAIDWQRVAAVRGDLQRPQLGIDAAGWAALTTTIDCVIHNGCYVNGLLPYALLKDANVSSTVECMRLCATGGHKRLVYVSSLSALRPLERSEDTVLTTKGLARMSGYGATKRVSEILVAAAVARGLDAVVVRPGTIGGAQGSGACNPGDTITKLLLGCAQLRAVPDVDDHISLAPVEYVADVVLRAAMQTQPPAARVFNVFGAAVAWRAVATALDTACGAPLRRLPLPAFVSLLDTAPGNALAPLRSYFARNNFPLLDDATLCSGANTARLCGNAPLPPITDALLARYLAYLRVRDAQHK